MQKSEFIECVHAENSGQVLLHGELSINMAREVARALANFFGYYCYPSVSLHLHSPGGDLKALQHLIEAISKWRRDGRKIKTESTFEAISAAAVLLCLGDVGHRRVGQRAALLFHTSRLLDRERPLTSLDAKRVAGFMDDADQFLITQMAEHIQHGMGGMAAMAMEGAARCELIRNFRQNSTSVPGPTTASKTSRSRENRSADRTWNAMESMYRACERRSNIEPFIRYIHARLVEDTVMHPTEAYALCLVDAIEDIDVLPARAAHSAQYIQPKGSVLKQKRSESSEGQSTEISAPPNDSEQPSVFDDWTEANSVTTTQPREENATPRHR